MMLLRFHPWYKKLPSYLNNLLQHRVTKGMNRPFRVYFLNNSWKSRRYSRNSDVHWDWAQTTWTDERKLSTTRWKSQTIGCCKEKVMLRRMCLRHNA